VVGLNARRPTAEPSRCLEGKEKAWVLDSDGELVSTDHREIIKSQGEQWCNHWPCKEKQTPNKMLSRCGKCKEVLYCCQQHQLADWKIHKGVCVKGSDREPGYSGPFLGLIADGTMQRFGSWHDVVDRRA